jgi:hypothetical protein
VPAGGAELTSKEGAAARNGAAAGDRTAAGQITSAAELTLSSERRVFALGMLRSEAEEREQVFEYKAGSLEGTARILGAPPKLGQKRL